MQKRQRPSLGNNRQTNKESTEQKVSMKIQEADTHYYTDQPLRLLVALKQYTQIFIPLHCTLSCELRIVVDVIHFASAADLFD